MKLTVVLILLVLALAGCRADGDEPDAGTDENLSACVELREVTVQCVGTDPDSLDVVADCEDSAERAYAKGCTDLWQEHDRCVVEAYRALPVGEDPDCEVLTTFGTACPHEWSALSACLEAE